MLTVVIMKSGVFVFVVNFIKVWRLSAISHYNITVIQISWVNHLRIQAWRY